MSICATKHHNCPTCTCAEQQQGVSDSAALAGYKPVSVTLELRTIHQIKLILETAIGNAEELLNRHEAELGCTTKKSQLIAEMYETEIANARNMISILNQWYRLITP